MNRRTWKDFLTKRSTIWTLSLCLVGAIVLGGMAAVNSSRNNSDTQSETELGQIAYLEEDLNNENEADGNIQTAGDNSAANGTDADIAAEADEETASASTSGASGSADTDSSLIDGSGDSADAVSNSNTAASVGKDSSDSSGSGDAGTSDDFDSDDTAAADTSDDSGSDGTAVTNSSDASSSDTTDTSAADASDTEEASSSSIISEQVLIEAGVSFTDNQSILWPCAGTVVIDYSMDKSVYFSTLNQYKYNPALIISSDSGNQVLASAKGIVESISIDEETGTTLVLNIGNGYKLTYGQLMEPAVSEGDVVEAGDLLAYISEPTKYYSTEGSNLYFAMTKNGDPVDPVLYLD